MSLTLSIFVLAHSKAAISSKVMQLRKVSLHILLFMLVIVVLSAISVWLGLGPVVLSP
jgi:uncharacterized membrane protein